MLKLKRHLIGYLLAFGLVIAQSAIFLTHYEHELSQPDCKCSICLVANQLAHAMTSSGFHLDLDHYIPAPFHDNSVIHLTTTQTVYSIRAPPNSFV